VVMEIVVDSGLYSTAHARALRNLAPTRKMRALLSAKSSIYRRSADFLTTCPAHPIREPESQR
jgi:hypothetical protein